MAGIIILVSWLLDVLAVAVSHSYASVWIFMTNPGNQWFYNLSMPIIIILYAILYYTIFDDRNAKRLSIYGTALFLILHFADLIWLQGTSVTDTYSIVAGQVFIGLLAFFYLRQVVETSDESPFRNFLFWFSISVLISNLVTTPVTSLMSWLPFRTPDTYIILYNIIGLYFGYYFCYLIIIIGLIWTRKLRTSY